MTNALIAALLMTGQTADLDKMVSLSTFGTTVQGAMQQLSQASGVPIEVHPAAANEVLVINVKEVSMRQLLDKVVKVTGNKWMDASGTIRVVHDAEREEKKAIEDRQGMLENLRQAREILNQLTRKQKIGSGEDSWDWEPDANFLFMNRVIQTIPNSAFNMAATQERYVLSTSPYRGQGTLPNIDRRLLDAWVAEVNQAFADESAAGNEEEDFSDSPEYQQYLERMEELYGKRPKREPIKDLNKIIVAITPYPAGKDGSFNVALKVLDSRGRTVLQSEESLHPDYIRDNYGFPPRSEGEGTAPAQATEEEMSPADEGDESWLPAWPSDSQPLQLGPISKQMLAMSKQMFAPTPPSGDQTQILEILRQPDQYEPLAYPLGEALHFSAGVSQKNLVACLPDTFGFSYSMQELKDVRSLRRQVHAFEDDAEKEWWVISPFDISESKKDRVDRPSLAKFLSQTANGRTPTLDESAAFAFANPTAEENGVAQTRLQLLAGGAFQTLFGESSWDMLRLYGAMSTAQRGALRRGERVSVGSLNAAAKGILTDMISGARLAPYDDSKPPQAPTLGSMFGDSGNPWAYMIPRVDEPSEILANGLSPQGYIVAAVEEGPCLLAQENTLMGGGGAFGPMETAMFRQFMAQPQFAAEMQNFNQMFSNMRVGDRTVLHVKAVLIPGQAISGTLQDLRNVKRSNYGLNNLPPAMQSAVAAQEEAMKKDPFFQMMLQGFQGMGGGQPPIKP
jgi:hypothetical protein